MKEIKLSQGKIAIVDDKNYDTLSQWKWHVLKQRTGKFYAVRNIYLRGKRTLQYMHEAITGSFDCPDIETHHKNENGLDNQEENLIKLSVKDHRRITRQSKDSYSGYRGVVWYSSLGKWKARINNNGVRIQCGTFKTAEEAAVARDNKAWELGWPEEGMNFPMIPVMPRL